MSQKAQKKSLKRKKKALEHQKYMQGLWTKYGWGLQLKTRPLAGEKYLLGIKPNIEENTPDA